MKYKCDTIITENYLYNLLKKRGVNEIDGFLHPNSTSLINPFCLDNIAAAASNLVKAIEEDWHICIIVDCDTDGYTSAAMLWNYIKDYKSDAHLTYKIHEGKEHGLSDLIDEILEDRTIKLVVLPDAGSSDEVYYEQLFDAGIQAIYIDHHEAEAYSNYAIGVNNQLSNNYENKALSGAGVVFKFLQILDGILERNNAYDYLDLAAVGIVADCMLLNTLENRFIVHYGLSHIRNNGLQELLNKQAFVISDIDNPTSTDISWSIAPLINAMVRIGRQDEKDLMFQSFIDGKKMIPKISRGKVVPDRYESVGEQSARNCYNAKNRQDSAVEKHIDMLEYEIIKNSLDENKIIVLDVTEENINSTLTGLLAMKLAAKFKKPVLLGRLDDNGYLRGSGRSETKEGFTDLRQYLLDSGYFEYVRGHANAHGFSINESNIDSFLDKTNNALKHINFEENFYPVDFIMDGKNEELKTIINELGDVPQLWGAGVEEPRIAIENIRIKSTDINICGKNLDTLRFTYNNVTYIKFHAKDLIEEIENAGDVINITIIGAPNVNHFRGVDSPQIMIKGYEIDTIFNDIMSF